MENPLVALFRSQNCQHCSRQAYWAVNYTPLCYLHLREMAEMNSDNGRAVYDALVSPELVEARRNDVVLRIYPTTGISALCAMINQLHTRCPLLDADAEIIIERWQDAPDAPLVLTGIGYYALDTTTTQSNAPTIKLSRAPQASMCGFMQALNIYSKRMRRYLEREFTEEDTSHA